MSAYLTTMFWLGILSVVVRCFQISKDHPRTEETNIGTDLLTLLIAIAMLAWVSCLKFSS